MAILRVQEVVVVRTSNRSVLVVEVSLLVLEIIEVLEYISLCATSKRTYEDVISLR